MKTLSTIIFLAFLTIGNIQGQKYGHVNSNDIIMAIPEVKAADTEIEDYSNKLILKGQDMVKKYETAYQGYAAQANRGELNQIQMQQGEADLTTQKAAIEEYEIEVQNLIGKKKQEVYQPILDKVQQVIVNIGKEMGYTMIFDSFSMGMVFAQESEDIMPLVKERLGIQ